ncbi:hypothetical protein LTR39_001251 [Cryomyces antarcticus]|nr:hypothetical protein LTR39_001251 [Cryomyces antarcticus]
MVTIEELPNGKAVSIPGWAYVPDNCYDPSKAPLDAGGDRRKRARNAQVGGGAGGDLSARQQNAIAKHIAELDKDSHRDVQIPVPSKGREGGDARASTGSKRMTNVRKILLSQKTFANHLADEEALPALQPTRPVATPATTTTAAAVASPRSAAPSASKPPVRASKTPIARRKPPLPPSASPLSTPAPALSGALSISTPTTPQTPSTPMGPPPLPQSQLPPSHQLFSQTDPPPSTEDVHPLLQTHSIPTIPTAAEIEALLSHPPLNYNAARAGPPPSSAPPQRHFSINDGIYEFDFGEEIEFHGPLDPVQRDNETVHLPKGLEARPAKTRINKARL